MEPSRDHRIRWGHFDDPPGIGTGAFTVLLLHGAFALVLVGLVYAAKVMEDTAAVMLGAFGGVTQLVYIIPLLIVRRGPPWRRFRIGVMIVAGMTFVVSAFLVITVKMALHAHYGR